MKEGLDRDKDGQYTVVTRECPDCGESYVFLRSHVSVSVRHRRWLSGELQPEVPIPVQPPTIKYSHGNVPKRIVFGVSALCPRCHGLTKVREGRRSAEAMDPHKPTQICPRCDGFGIVPNQSV